MAEHGIKQDSAAGREEFEKRMELGRADEEKEQWKEIRRGWCFGSDEFRKEMLARTEGAKPETLSLEMRKEAGKPTAEKIVKEELSRLKWKEKDLKTRQKSDPEKMRIAARLRKETTLTVKEISIRLNLGTVPSATTNLRQWMQSEKTAMGRRRTSSKQ